MTCKSHFRSAVNETHDRAVSSMQYTERKTVQLHFLSYEQQITCLPHTAHVSASRTKIVSLIIVSILPCIHVHHTSLAHTETQLDIMLVYSEVSMINSQVCLFSGLWSVYFHRAIEGKKESALNLFVILTLYNTKDMQRYIRIWPALNVDIEVCNKPGRDLKQFCEFLNMWVTRYMGQRFLVYEGLFEAPV